MCCGHGSKQSHELISGASEEKVVAADKHPSRHSGERHQRRGEHFCSRLQPGHRASWVSLRNIKELSDQPRRQTKRVSTGQYTLHTRTLIRTHTHTHTHTHSHALTRTRTYPHTCTHKTHPHTHTHMHTHTHLDGEIRRDGQHERAHEWSKSANAGIKKADGLDTLEAVQVNQKHRPATCCTVQLRWNAAPQEYM